MVINDDNNPNILQFGKHKGADIADVPTHYLVWVEENFDGLWDETRKAINQELERRSGNRPGQGRLVSKPWEGK